MCLLNTELQVEEVELLVKLHINENSFGLAAEDWLESDSLYFFHILFTSMVRVFHKLASIDEVYKLNVGQI